ncbi:MAG: gliding motility-associated C-terminal domain-containing protein [Candidatus Latescibacteria bacterium]|nr:gliding motility-associated C-terminal domain-containing protein [Candidatus Latescibacterota bacterium]
MVAHWRQFIKSGTILIGVGLLVVRPAVAVVDTLVVGGAGRAWFEDGELRGLDDATTPGWIQLERTKQEQNILNRLFDDNRLFAGRDPTSADFQPGDARIWTPNGSFGENFDLLRVADGKRDSTSFNAFNRERNNNGVIIFIDLGSAFPVNEFKFYPLSFGAHRDLYMKGFELSVNDGSPETLNEEALPIYSLVRAVPRNVNQETTVQFAAQHVRFLKLRSSSAQPFEIDQIEVRGSGFVKDLGAVANLGDIIWGSNLEPGSALSIQSRVGEDRTTRVYNRINEFGVEVPIQAATDAQAQDEWEKLPTDARGSVREDLENWTTWSLPYAHSGGRIATLGPRRFLQVRASMTTLSPDHGAAMDSLGIQFQYPLLAQQLMGRIAPRQDVELGAETEFRYTISPTFADGDVGFDMVQIVTSAPAEVTTVRVGQTEVPAGELKIEQEDGVISIQLPDPDSRVSEESDSVEVIFTSSLLEFGHTFSSEVFASEEQAAFGQKVQEARSGELLVEAKKSSLGTILGNVGIDSNLFTPNGDGANDSADISFAIFQAFEAIPVRLAIYDLSGREVRELLNQAMPRGSHRVEWDGRSNTGHLVPPGMYLCSDTFVEVVSVALVY